MTINSRVIVGLIALAVIQAVPIGCGDESGGNNDTLTIFAAASLTSSFNELGDAFEADHDGVTIDFNFAGSQALATQLVEGARADVYASANMTQMDRVEDAGLIQDVPVIFARNLLAIIVPADNPANIHTINDLAKSDLKLVLAAEEAPVGCYARQTLDMLADTEEFQELYPGFSGFSIVSTETNVLQVVTRVRLGEADAGIVYETDLTPDIEEEVLLIPIPDNLNIEAEYPLASLADGNVDLGREFIEFVRSDNGQRILAAWGFRPGDSE